MRCPKCHYLSFEPEPRCRNCGHALDLSGPLDMPIPGLVADETDVESGTRDTPRLSLDMPTPAAPHQPVATEPVKSSSESGPPPALMRERPRLKPDPVPGPFDTSTSRRESPPAPPTASAAPTTELPLFVKQLPESPDLPDFDEPLVKVPPSPRAPLAVRMKTADPAPIPERIKETAAETDAFGDLLDDLRRVDRFEHRHAAADLRARESETSGDDRPAASSRVVAAGIDASLLAAVILLVLWVTLRWCDLSVSQIGMLPVVPTTSFFVLIVLGYLLLFTAAGGQTIGKMVAHIRVVDDAAGEPAMVTIAQAFYRSCATVLSVALLGLGWLPGLVGERRALHDRLAGTRVVQA